MPPGTVHLCERILIMFESRPNCIHPWGHKLNTVRSRVDHNTYLVYNVLRQNIYACVVYYIHIYDEIFSISFSQVGIALLWRLNFINWLRGGCGRGTTDKISRGEFFHFVVSNHPGLGCVLTLPESMVTRGTERGCLWSFVPFLSKKTCLGPRRILGLASRIGTKVISCTCRENLMST